MMNHNPHGGPPMYPHGRRPHEMQYNPQQQYAQNYYPYGYPQPLPQHFHHGPPQQWAYQNMQNMGAMGRPYPYPMMNPAYPMAQAPSMSPRPNPPQHMHSSSSVRSHQSIPSPSPGPDRSLQPSQPFVPAHRPSPPPAAVAPAPAPAAIPTREPFRLPPLPWSPTPDEIPEKTSRRKRLVRSKPPAVVLELPSREEADEILGQEQEQEHEVEPVSEATTETIADALADAPVSEQTVETPDTSIAPSEDISTNPTTPASQLPTATAGNATRQRKVMPVVPAIPSIPGSRSRDKKTAQVSAGDSPKIPESVATESVSQDKSAETGNATAESIVSEDKTTDTSTADVPQTVAPEKAAPKSWADLVRIQSAANAVPSTTNGQIVGQNNDASGSSGESKAALFSSFSVRRRDSGNKLSFIKPRGLINTGNMCYMNSILQVLLFCVPFYDFLEQARKQAAYSFKSETPMIDAMIEFIREFEVIDSASSPEQLNLRLKDQELEEYGHAFTPEFVYDVIRRVPRFASMRRGHQQDAEEFLGFLLEEMHDECVRVVKGVSASEDSAATTDASAAPSEDSGWHEVGPKQKAAITRSAGIEEVESPINKIFGGKLRSELRVPGAKPSVTLEPYQPLQLDIGSPQITNITEALKGLTRSETLHGDFNSPRGPGVNATKQVFVESLPPVLILHLKRFQYDNAGGTQKIWKKVGYPLELEIPKEVFPQHKRGGILAHGGLPKYRLIGVVYHHGKNASGGHYTVDVRRQNDREWIRLDDTIIRRVKSEDVAEGGAEEDPKLLSAALEQHKRDDNAGQNIFDAVREENEQGSQEKGWNQVNGGAAAQATKKWSGVVNGATTPTSSSGRRTPVGRYSVKDNKVAYILFYQKIGY